MSWTSPITWSPNQLVTAADLNAHLRDNIAYVHSGRPAVSIIGTQGDIVGSGGAAVEIDPTNLSITISTTTGRVLVTAMCRLYSATSHAMWMGLNIDGAGSGIWNQVYASVNPVLWTMASIRVGLTPGPHTFRLLWNPAGVSTTLLRNSGEPCQFCVAEL